MNKTEVRELARDWICRSPTKSDSQEICFVPNGDYAASSTLFQGAGHRARANAGRDCNADGRVLGEHAGVHHFTVGQRRGLGIAAPEPLYVIATEPATQRVVVRPRMTICCAASIRRQRRQLDFDRRSISARPRRSQDSQ